MPPLREDALAFWDDLRSGEYPDEPRSLKAAVARSDLIIVGRPQELRTGDEVNGFGVTRLVVAIDDLVWGDPQTREPGTVTIQLMPAGPDTAAIMPTEQHLFFLRYVPWAIRERGGSVEDQQRELFDYAILDGLQGPARNVEGVLRALDTRNRERFPALLDGRPFDEVVERVRELVVDKQPD